jgi:hypothetical protein
MTCMLQNRRDFLRAGAAAAAGSTVAFHSRLARAATAFGGQVSGSLSGARPENAPIQLGMCSYTFRDFDRARVIDYMNELKLTHLNAKDVKDHLPMTPPDGTDHAVADYTAVGIRLSAVGTVYFQKDEDDDVRAKFDYAKRAGVRIIVAGDPTVQTLPRLEKFAKEYNIRIAINNHGPEDKVWPSPLDVLKSIKGMDPHMGCCIDVGHTVRAGTDVVDAIKHAGSRLFDLHMKDLTDFSAKESQVPVGDGKMPVREIFEALIAIKYKGYVDLEYEAHSDDPMPGATKSVTYMRDLLSEMGYTSA